MSRQVKEKEIFQGVDESVAYAITTTPWGSSPSSPVVAVYDVSDRGRMDVTASVTTGSVSITGDVITLPLIHGLTAGKIYRVEVKFVIGSSTLEAWFSIKAED